MNDTSFAFLDATALAGLVRRGEVTPGELLEATIERIERLNPELNAVITRMDDLAREAAGEIAANPDQDMPFPGVPFLIKDLVAEYAGVPIAEGRLRLSFGPIESKVLKVRGRRRGARDAGE